MPTPNLDQATVDSISTAMKAIWFRAGLLDPRLKPLDVPDIGTAVEALRDAYSRVGDKDYVWPTVLQALIAVASTPVEGREGLMNDLLGVMGGSDSDQKRLRAATSSSQALRTALQEIESSPLAYTDDCEVVNVVVDGYDAVFLYAGFTTKAPFDKLQGWLDPHEWHDRSPVLFRSVRPIREPVKGTWASYNMWHQTFAEEATPFPDGTAVRNLLACDNATSGSPAFSITCYDLDGRDNDVLVDCGYLMIRDMPEQDYRAASFVKMIGFKDPSQNSMVPELKHMWVSLIRAVAEGDATSPSTGSPVMGDPTAVDDGQTSVNQLVQGWVDASTSCIQASGSLAGNLIGGFVGPRFGWDDFRRTVTGYWSDIAQQYVSAWSTTQGAVAQMAPPDSVTATRARVMMGPGAATSWVAVEPTAEVGESVEFSEMRCISDSRMMIPPARITGQVVADHDQRLVALRVNAQGLKRGVYVGTARLASFNGPVPTFVYVTGATVKAS